MKTNSFVLSLFAAATLASPTLRRQSQPPFTKVVIANDNTGLEASFSTPTGFLLELGVEIQPLLRLEQEIRKFPATRIQLLSPPPDGSSSVSCTLLNSESFEVATVNTTTTLHRFGPPIQVPLIEVDLEGAELRCEVELEKEAI
ncbi:hypothetical protein K458DRAFT_488341 [Lentithecium fluviatile CBS 122367]|uniref:Ubiquitin 3 binding protein But2 C-terminal domain-containing protein n=1 Tax=Lentithecium fluviatile CBS 122367 TaxID=1168545 RepID=A0A6G1IY67_9PLEO|nr:hypothetical protein K458DRAFT_488341 [Lentithecium fluviatile CBS 122367]